MRYRRNKGPVVKKIWIDSASSFRQTEHSLCRRKNTMRISIALLALFAPAAAISAANSTTPVKPGRIHGPIIHQRHGHQVSSTNWSGYAITGAKGSVSDVRASWVVPSVRSRGCRVARRQKVHVTARDDHFVIRELAIPWSTERISRR